MKRLLVLTLLALPPAAAAQELNNADLDAAPAPKAAAAAEAAAPETLQRPDAQAIMAELSAALRLSSKQEERISAAINKKTKEFDKLMKDYEKNSIEEKKWLYKVNENHHGMLKINREMPDLVREFLDDEQRQSYDSLLEAKRKPAAVPVVEAEEPAVKAAPAAKPVKKRKLVRRKKVAGKTSAAAQALAAQAPAAQAAAPAAAAEGAEEPGQVMVDKDTAPEAKPAPQKKRVLVKKKPLTKGAPPASEASEDLEGSKPDNQQQEPEEGDEDAGSYP